MSRAETPDNLPALRKKQRLLRYINKQQNALP